MTDEVSAEVIKKTQETLGKFIKKPPLTDKLLKKPPFRFLHDIVTNVINETGFLSGLYTSTEMQSENIKDRDLKIAFLQKLIDALKIITGAKISARPSKIIAGLEATKTNQLLQVISSALEKKLDSKEAVQQITGVVDKNEKNSREKKSRIEEKTKKKIEETKKLTKEKSVVQKKKPSPRTESETRKMVTTKTNREKLSRRSQSKDSESPKEKELAKEKKRTTKPKDSEKLDEVPVKKEVDEPMKPVEEVKEHKAEEVKEMPSIEEKPQIPEPIQEIIPDPREFPKIEEPQSNEPEPMITKKELKRPTTSLRPPSVRPSSARPGAPRLKDRADTILPPDQLIPLGKVNVIIENFGDKNEQDDEETVVLEAPVETTTWPSETIEDIPAEKGHLVSQILEQIGEQPIVAAPKAQIKWEQKSSDVGSAKLRQSIQTLTRAANPLGKLINFLHEDVDSMQAELKMWMDVNEKLKTEIKFKKGQNEESTKPLQEQLSRLEADIAKQHEMIALTQANILKNHNKIRTLLTRD